MKKRWSTLCLAAIVLSGCIAGAGEPYDDTESTYEPTVELNETIVEDSNYTVIVEDVLRKSHDDVGNIVEVIFSYDNKTDETLYLTANAVRFDEADVDISVMAFFEELPPKSSGNVSAIFQDIQEKDFFVPPLTKSLAMDLELVEQQSTDVRATYTLNVTF